MQRLLEKPLIKVLFLVQQRAVVVLVVAVSAVYNAKN
jgi:hypothetical protein